MPVNTPSTTLPSGKTILLATKATSPWLFKDGKSTSGKPVVLTWLAIRVNAKGPPCTGAAITATRHNTDTIP